MTLRFKHVEEGNKTRERRSQQPRFRRSSLVLNAPVHLLMRTSFHPFLPRIERRESLEVGKSSNQKSGGQLAIRWAEMRRFCQRMTADLAWIVNDGS